MDKERLEQIHRLLLAAYCHIPSKKQCQVGDARMLAANCEIAEGAVKSALDLVLEAVNRP